MSVTSMKSQADITMNVRVIVAKKNQNGQIEVKTEKRFKNTATRLMT